MQQQTLRLRLPLPGLPEVSASLLRTVVVALFLLTFVLQPFLIPSESMEHTLLVGDFCWSTSRCMRRLARKAA